jgi:hypothetical protein
VVLPRILGAAIGLALVVLFFLILAAALGWAIAGPIGTLVATLGLSVAAWCWITGCAIVLVTLFAYAIAAIALLPIQAAAAMAAPLLPVSITERFMSGVITGIAAGVNFTIWALLPMGPVGITIGSIIGTIGLLSAFRPFAVAAPFQTVLGWSSWLMPYSWLATAVGLLLFLVNLPFALAAFGPGAIRFDPSTSTVESTGGVVGIAFTGGGFNLGNFTFLSPSSGVGLGIQSGFTVPGLSAHETGHTLTVASFGGVFHWIGAIDENVPPLRRGPAAYSEVLPESHLPRPLPSRHVLQWS